MSESDPAEPTVATPTRRRGAGIRDSVRFVQRFLSSPASVGAILPSSRYLAQAMVADLGLRRGDLVVEYGPGTGPMTQALADLGLQAAGVQYLGIELDEKFERALRLRFPALDFHHGSVAEVARILQDRGLGRVKAIVSGLPFASLPGDVQRAVVDNTHEVLAEHGQFRTFQYVHAYGMRSARRFRRMMDERFERFHRSRPVLRNVPPAYVLTYSERH